MSFAALIPQVRRVECRLRRDRGSGLSFAARVGKSEGRKRNFSPWPVWTVACVDCGGGVSDAALDQPGQPGEGKGGEERR
ncbi:A disintegrin and metalloproteinase with thrombospondin motifs 6 [Frankliniella fusca]|uniref:A disintegrin and metalloproteinase with thrombospondin motifs 6 n=1 Tax=Frankliniella fusca TaxID=407009 RepID=A0AAE1HBW4_9NEOP|nr:A disintegrin and metalloproteinase with thrombospondin motifs 6 [Frankliniella fusca]